MAFLLYDYSYMDKEEKAKDCITLIESNPLEEFDERNGTGSHQTAAGAGHLHGAADAGLLPDADRPVEDADSEHDIKPFLKSTSLSVRSMAWLKKEYKVKSKLLKERNYYFRNHLEVSKIIPNFAVQKH